MNERLAAVVDDEEDEVELHGISVPKRFRRKIGHPLSSRVSNFIILKSEVKKKIATFFLVLGERFNKKGRRNAHNSLDNH